MPVSGILAETAIGWKLIFYSISGLTLITAAVWYFAAASSPEEHRLMGNEEQKYIEKGLKSANIKVRNKCMEEKYNGISQISVTFVVPRIICM